MLMSFEKYMNEEMDFLKNLESSAAYPSVFELICLLPISKRAQLIEEALFSIDDCII
ncbi:MAG: hypothetical protein ACK5MV_08810 [Aminipila sp.]